MRNFTPSYLNFSGRKLASIKDELFEFLRNCKLCPRSCCVNRLESEVGFCKTALYSRVSSFNLHFGEEPELVGRGGSGTIFFSFCNLGCIYCQNHTISHSGEGRELDGSDLALIMLRLQTMGAHNINFVTPTHVLPQILEALIIAKDKGLRLPLVYNSGGYDSGEVLEKIEGIFDIYMPDAKYSEDENSRKYSLAEDYWDVCRKAIIEMHHQVGDLVTDSRGIARRGLLIRHLVLPNGAAGSFRVIDFIAEHISKDTCFNIMDQYRPCYKAYMHRELSRRITVQEYKEVIDYAYEKGLRRGFQLK